jgi:DNA-binding response OmpR family regulator
MSRSVDAVGLEYELSLLPGAAVAAEMKKVKPQVPIVMLTDHMELTDGTLKSVDALVTKSDGPHFLWATVHFILNVKPPQHLGRETEQIKRRHVCSHFFAKSLTKGIRNGTVQF